jgi:hypothetical protein
MNCMNLIRMCMLVFYRYDHYRADIYIGKLKKKLNACPV